MNDSSRLQQLFRLYTEHYYASFPESATYDGIHDHNHLLNDQSLEHMTRYNDSLRSFRVQLDGIDTSSLTEADLLNLELFAFFLDQHLDASDHKASWYLDLSQQSGYHITFPQISDTQPLSNDREVDDYLSRLTGFLKEADHIVVRLRKGREAGYVLPCRIAEMVQEQLAGFANMKVEAWPLYRVMEGHPTLASRERELYNVIDSSVVSGYNRIYDHFRNHYRPACRNQVGISSVPGGEEYYSYLVRYHTTTELTPEQIYTMGLSEVARIGDELTSVKEELGFGDLELKEFYRHIRNAPEFYFDSASELMAGYREILTKVDRLLPNLFGKLPNSPYDLKEMPDYMAPTAPSAYYYPLPADGSRPGYFYVNTYKLNARPNYSMTALALHEAVPGHHLQFALAKEMKNTPAFRSSMRVSGFEEGWALYAEYLGYEMELYEDPLQRLGALGFEIWRAARLVVDVGIHYKGWTREEAAAYMEEHVPLATQDIHSEVDRYIAWPGQALAYKVGELQIRALRNKAEQELGDRFDLRAFHDMLLANGSIPLWLLDRIAEQWIRDVKHESEGLE